ncbi:MAG: hypothetical protein ACI9Q4_002573, partial [Sediminicola sp.]
NLLKKVGMKNDRCTTIWFISIKNKKVRRFYLGIF